jgi:phosphoribosyl 1,2-cyclic phosphodiesterase
MAAYGGNTSCVVVEHGDAAPILLDLGTGLRPYGCVWPVGKVFQGTALVSHLHWDHVQGLPFFGPALAPNSSLDIYAPAQNDGRSVAEAFDAFMRPPYFPITIDQIPAEISFNDCDEGTFEVGPFSVMARLIPHVGATLGFRIEAGGRTIAYLPDHQQPVDGGFDVAPGAMELCRDVDLLIHDAQYTRDEFVEKAHWGHCSIDYAVALAAKARVKQLALFHHDPSHTDAQLDDLIECAADVGAKLGISVVGAREGLTISL